MLAEVNRVLWAVPPGSETLTRPSRLVSELQLMGVVSRSASFVHHGRARSTERSKRALMVGHRAVNRRDVAQLSPAFLGMPWTPGPRWIDLYDDWSIAPDLGRHQRVVSCVTYNRVRGGLSGSAVTVNSEYMRMKLQLPLSALVPNGVDATIGRLSAHGDRCRRLVILGKFFSGRTDWPLVRRLFQSSAFDEAVVGGLSRVSAAATKLGSWAEDSGVNLKVVDWISPSEMAQFVGPRTAAVVPHVVNDYTLSQDPMKIYTFLALGMRVIAPRLLWPPHLEDEYAYLCDFGCQFDETLPDWLEGTPPSADWRRDFVERNSWKTRALRIAEVLA